MFENIAVNYIHTVVNISNLFIWRQH